MAGAEDISHEIQEGLLSGGETDPLAEEEEEEEEEDGEEEEEEEEVGDEEGETSVEFQAEMNPLDFVQQDDIRDNDNNSSGDKLYQHFKRIDCEYEALHERKRKQLADNQREGVAKKPRKEETSEALQEDIWKIMSNMNMRRKRKGRMRKKGRRMGSKNKLSREVTRKLGDATLHFAHEHYQEAITLLIEVVREVPNFSEPYHTLALIYDKLGNKKKATNCYMLAAYLSPRDSPLWERCLTLSMDLGYIGQAWYCLDKAIKANPNDIALRYQQASHYQKIENYEKAAESYKQIALLDPDQAGALKIATKLYNDRGLVEHAASVLDDYIKVHLPGAKLSRIDWVASLCMENNDHIKALGLIENAKKLCTGEGLPLYLSLKEGICHLHLGNIEKAEICFSLVPQENVEDYAHLIAEVANSFMTLKHYEMALEYYQKLLESNALDEALYSNVAQCYKALNEPMLAIQFLYKALQLDKDNIDTRITLASVLIEEQRDEEAIVLLSNPDGADRSDGTNEDRSEPWWENPTVKLKLSHVYKAKGMLEAFVDVVFPLVHESLLSVHHKVKQRRRLSKSTLSERVKVLDDHQSDSVFLKYRKPSSKSDSLKAHRAKKKLEKIAAEKEEKKSAALAAGLDWESDDSDEDTLPEPSREAPLPDLLRDEQQFNLIKELCNAFMSLGRFGEALRLIGLILRLSTKILSGEKKKDFRSIGAQIAMKVTDPSDAFDYVRYTVQQNLQSVAAWNCYYKLSSRLGNRYPKHNKFLQRVRVLNKDLVPPKIIAGNQFTMIGQHQAAAREYLEAYRLMPESPLINLCVGTALINLALGHRLQNKHECVTQGLAFLFNNLRLCGNSQEALYNIARAFHHIGLVTLAASYYEKVLAIKVRDCPLPKAVLEHDKNTESPRPGYCDLRREAAFALHLIYKQSGARDLARQVLKDNW